MEWIEEKKDKQISSKSPPESLAADAENKDLSPKPQRDEWMQV